jgi:hypothetical protein
MFYTLVWRDKFYSIFDKELIKLINLKFLENGENSSIKKIFKFCS